MAERNLQTASDAITLTGVRETRGDAVDCPKLRADDGTLHPVARLPADVAIGDRVSVTGSYGITTTCKGQVLVIADLKRL